MNSNSAISLVATHLNAAAGPVLTETQLSAALIAGSVDGIENSTAAALISYLFVEIEPRLIFRCAGEAGANLAQVNQLYQETLKDSLPRVFAWEKALEFAL